METINVLVARPFPAALMNKLENISPRFNITQRVPASAEELADLVGSVEILYAPALLPEPEDAPRLRWVQIHSAGADQILQHRLFTETDVTITTTSGIHAVNIAEYVFAQMLAFAHHLPTMFEDKRAKNWPEDRWERYLPHELRGATVGIVGYGSIGREVARLADAFGMRVLAVKANLRKLTNEDAYQLPDTGDPEAEIPDRIYPVEALTSMASECDYLVLTLPLTDRTRGLVNASTFAAMKSTAVLINVARGGIVDEGALIDALRRGHIAGAALDVFEEEPLPPESPLWELPNVILSPHISGVTPHYDERATDLFAENLRRFAAGEPLLNVVSRQRGY
ncbi:MAG TPA: D-2-hydroxyacid dehydrogenase [Aggregatilineales bacterium]|nr:D-2-hydroxyacid dehydrogenase [Aggregatilineales bacterium]